MTDMRWCGVVSLGVGEARGERGASSRSRAHSPSATGAAAAASTGSVATQLYTLYSASCAGDISAPASFAEMRTTRSSLCAPPGGWCTLIFAPVSSRSCLMTVPPLPMTKPTCSGDHVAAQCQTADEERRGHSKPPNSLAHSTRTAPHLAKRHEQAKDSLVGIAFARLLLSRLLRLFRLATSDTFVGRVLLITHLQWPLRGAVLCILVHVS